MNSPVRIREPDRSELLLDQLDAIQATLRDLVAHARLTALEPWLSKRELAAHLAVSARWIDDRVAEGMPHRALAGGHKFRVTAAEDWLRRRGLLEET